MAIMDRGNLFGYFLGNKKNPWLVLLQETLSKSLRQLKSSFSSFLVFLPFLFLF
jgi:hypothetical protein